MSLTTIIPATTRNTPAERFAHTVYNVSTYLPGTDTSFGLGAAHVEVWCPNGTTWVLRLIETGDDYEMVAVKTVAVVLGEFDRWDVQAGDGQLILADGFKGIEAAIGYALDQVTSPVWAAGVQDQHDTFGC